MPVYRKLTTKESRAYWKSIDATVMCKDHPKYKVLRKPRVACEQCWYLWFTFKYANKTRGL